MSFLRPFLIALQFLTCLPIRYPETPDPQEIGRSVVYYPFVGVLIGALLAGMMMVLAPRIPTLLCAALLLAAWILITGMLHLDGLADSADAWLGGLGDRERTLAIMKDPCCGPAGVATLVIVLIVKFAALDAIVAAHNWTLLVLVPLLARTTLPLLFLTTPYVRPGGLGSLLARHLPRRTSMAVLMAIVIVTPVAAGKPGFYLLLVVTGVFLFLRARMLRRIGGTTGDTAGALVEITETIALATAQMM